MVDEVGQGCGIDESPIITSKETSSKGIRGVQERLLLKDVFNKMFNKRKVSDELAV